MLSSEGFSVGLLLLLLLLLLVLGRLQRMQEIDVSLQQLLQQHSA